MTELDLPRDLRWRCRRGMRELDTLLTHWLHEHWPEATDELRSAFRVLLEVEDDRLWDWLTGRDRPESGVLAEIVDDIRRAATSSD